MPEIVNQFTRGRKLPRGFTITAVNPFCVIVEHIESRVSRAIVAGSGTSVESAIQSIRTELEKA
jgi:hypothetical protein